MLRLLCLAVAVLLTGTHAQVVTSSAPVEPPVDTTLSIWLDLWYIKDHFMIFKDGTTWLELNITATHHIITFNDDSRMWVSNKLPIPADYILNIGIVNASKTQGSYKKQMVRLFENTEHIDALKYRTSYAYEGKPRGVLHRICSTKHLNQNSHLTKRYHSAIPVCEIRQEALSDQKYREWAQHQRDNTVGVEARLFEVEANGDNVKVADRHATLSYSFTANAWFVFPTAQGSTILFWQGNVALCTVVVTEGKHFYKIYLAELVETYSSEKLANGAPEDILTFSVVRDIHSTVWAYENGKPLKLMKAGDGADALFSAFERINDDMSKDVVIKLEAHDDVSTEAQIKEVYESTKGKLTVPAKKPKTIASKKDKKYKEEPARAPDDDNGSDNNDDKLPGVPHISLEPVMVKINGMKANGGSQHVGDAIMQGDFTVSMFVSGRNIEDGTVLLWAEEFGVSMRTLQDRDSQCEYEVHLQSKSYVTTPAAVDDTSPTHLALVYKKDTDELAVYIKGTRLDLSPLKETPNVLQREPNFGGKMGPVLSFDIIAASSPPEYIRSLASLRAFGSASGPKVNVMPTYGKRKDMKIPLGLEAEFLPHVLVPTKNTRPTSRISSWTYLTGFLGLCSIVFMAHYLDYISFTGKPKGKGFRSRGKSLQKVI